MILMRPLTEKFQQRHVSMFALLLSDKKGEPTPSVDVGAKRVNYFFLLLDLIRQKFYSGLYKLRSENVKQKRKTRAVISRGCK
jgi:hypothetical protein